MSSNVIQEYFKSLFASINQILQYRKAKSLFNLNNAEAWIIVIKVYRKIHHPSSVQTKGWCVSVRKI